ncbi:MAG: pirin family protein, partial [Planctomycetota bacterium]
MAGPQHPGSPSRPSEPDAEGPIDTVVVPRVSDIGGFQVRRALPTRRKKLVGPFIFFDRMGPARLGASDALDVQPHPHIGLATVTYLYEGRIRHLDSLGTDQVIEPGAINLMTAGRGIVHSERSPAADRGTERGMSGLQIWLALPEGAEESAPAFEHTPADALPTVEDAGFRAEERAHQDARAE